MASAIGISSFVFESGISLTGIPVAGASLCESVVML